jgi:hypothetical protein
VVTPFVDENPDVGDARTQPVDQPHVNSLTIRRRFEGAA